MRKPMLAAFDFDGTLTDGDTPTDILELGGEDMSRYLSNLEYTEDLTVRMEFKIRDIQKSKGITAEDIRTTALKIPLSQDMDRVLHLLKSHGCEVIIISDSMDNLIKDWLAHRSVSSLVENVYANPCYFDSEGCIVIEPYHIQEQCNRSFRNLCKGRVLEEYVDNKKSEGVTFDRLAYFGDGRNDLCPMLRLGVDDLAFPKDDSKLIHILNSTAQGQVKATIHPWLSAQDLIETLTKYLHSSD